MGKFGAFFFSLIKISSEIPRKLLFFYQPRSQKVALNVKEQRHGIKIHIFL